MVDAVALSEQHIVRVRGLPWSCTEKELVDFFDGVNIASIHFTKNREGRPSGDAYLVLASLRDSKEALKMHKSEMGSRYLEVFEARYSEMSWMLEKNVATYSKALHGEFDPTTDNIVKMRGLPFEAGSPEVVRFFDGMEISDGGILICKDQTGRPSGEAFCQFETEEASEAALGKDNCNMGHRYIEVFKSNRTEALKAKTRNEGGGGWEDRGFGGRGGGYGPMRGGGFGGGPMRGGGFGGGPMRGGRPGPYDRPGGPPGPYDIMALAYGQGMGPGGFGRGRGGPAGARGGYADAYSGYGDDSYARGAYGAYGGAPVYPGGKSQPPLPGYGRPGADHVVKMRGLPFRATDSEIREWFSSVADAQDITIQYGDDGRPNGQAEVTFLTHAEAKLAMTKHKQNMQSRYIELFYEGTY